MRKIFKHSDTSQDEIEQERLLEQQWRKLTELCDDGDEESCKTLEKTYDRSSIKAEPGDEYGNYGAYPSWPGQSRKYEPPKCPCGSGEKPQLYIDQDSGRTAMVCPKCEDLKRKEIKRKDEADKITNDVLEAFDKIRAKQLKKRKFRKIPRIAQISFDFEQFLK